MITIGHGVAKGDFLWEVTYRSRYYPLEGVRKKTVSAPSRSHIRQNWHQYIETDEYKIVEIVRASI